MADDSLSDHELLRRHVAGDPEAFAEIVRRHRNRLWAVALRTLGDPEEAADALQDALLSAFRGAASFRGESAVTTWMHRVVVNACLDRLRRRAARPEVPLPPETFAAVDDPFGAGELRIELAAALATLAPEQRVALLLVDVHGWSVVEAAEILACPVGTVKSRCARGRARLLPLLQHLRNPRSPHDVPSGEVRTNRATSTGGRQPRDR